MIFWLLALMLVAAVGAMASRPLWTNAPPAPSRAAHDVAMYRNQLSEVERDLARGALNAEEAEGARREIARRLLAADAALEREGPIGAAPERIAKTSLLAFFAPVLVACVVVYLILGDPSAPGQPLALRDIDAERKSTQLTQDAAEARAAPAIAAARSNAPPAILEGAESAEKTAALITRMEAALAERPNDVQGRLLLARAFLRLDRPEKAWPLFARVIAIQGDDAEPGLLAAMGEAMMRAANGYVSQEAEAALRRAPAEPVSQYLIGVAEAQRGEMREAMERWARLYVAAPQAPFASAVMLQIRTAAESLGLDADAIEARLKIAAGGGPRRSADPSAGGDPSAGAGAPGPTSEDVEAAGDLSAEDRAAMIEGMVAGLAERLKDEPKDLDGWLRLLRAYGVLGRREAAETAFADARAAFADDEAALARLADAARAAGVQP